MMGKIWSDKYLRELPEEQLDALKEFIGEYVGHATTAGELFRAIDIISMKRRNEARKKSGVLITTSCGEEHHFDPAQNVKTIMLNGEQVYPHLDWIDSVKVGDMVRAIHTNEAGRTHGFVKGGLYKIVQVRHKSHSPHDRLILQTPSGILASVYNFSVESVTEKGYYLL